ncbi:MAG: hypothetical protein IT422_02840 [Pirellulaceae bacterium]|nr:hypothetical protein [Pirellulaceae bacterium]
MKLSQYSDNPQALRTAAPRYAVKQFCPPAARKCCRRMLLFNRARARIVLKPSAWQRDRQVE